jgi:hypothetical protein
MARIMTPEHPDWKVFFLKLVMELDFRNEYKDNRAIVVDDCDNTFAKTIRILTKMGGVDIPSTLANFREQGADCDCKVCLQEFSEYHEGGK